MPLATALGWWTGSRSDDTIYPAHRPLYLLDTHWTDYDWPAHLAVARAERPALCAVPDILTRAGLPLALSHAEEIAPFCTSVLLIPKASVIDQIPATIGGVPVVVGYSVPSAYGGSFLPLWEYGRRPVHLLGGTPRRQIDCARYLSVVSADGNMAQKLAIRGLVFDGRGHGVPFSRFEPVHQGAGMPARALACSLTNISALWRRAGKSLEVRS